MAERSARMRRVAWSWRFNNLACSDLTARVRSRSTSPTRVPPTDCKSDGGGSKGSRRNSGAVPATVNADQLVGEVRNLPWSVVRFLGRDQPRGVGPAASKGGDPSVTTMFVNRRITMPALPIDTDQIVITASRAPEPEARTPGQRHHHRPAADRAARRAARPCPASADALGRGREHRARPDRSPRSAFAAPRANHTLLFIDGIESTIRPPAIRRASSCSTPTSPRASRSCAGRNPPCGARTRSAA